MLRRVLGVLGDPPIAIELWDGRRITTCDGEPKTRVAVRDRASLWRLARNPSYQFGELYATGRLDVDGPLERLMTVIYENQAQGLERKRSLASSLRRNSLRRAKNDIHRHYDLGNDFYRLWLDDRLVYTCAYYERPSMSLEEAQLAKMELVCRKVGLEPGMTVVEAGCGWGALALYMAERHGVNVKAYNISAEQVRHARQRAAELGLSDRVEFIQDDWRNIATPCDAFVSVGMLEHVGVENYQRLGRQIDKLLAPKGLGLIHSIGQTQPRQVNPWIAKHIFPGAYPPCLREAMRIFEPRALAVLDVEALRAHYAQTLADWLERFERNVSTVRERFGERFVRMWRLYLAGSHAAFHAGRLTLYQIVFARESCVETPMTRAHLYSQALVPAGPPAPHAGRLGQNHEPSAAGVPTDHADA